MILDRRTDSLTDFRDGDRNLHYLHVNKTDKAGLAKPAMMHMQQNRQN
ncbi:hypothetical protein [Geotalea toluenoxydans]|nr:hypothetical protein [Geotalea toluenoxydans]